MRISTNMIFEQGVAGMQRQQSALLKTQQQIAADRRILTPSDDPIAAAQALQITQSNDINTQFRVNRDHGQAQLQLTETSLTQAIDLVQTLRETAVAAGNGGLTDADRATLAQDVSSVLEQLIGVANATDADGKYLFAGYQGTTLPFQRSAGAVQYAGDDGERFMQAGASRQIAVNIPGATAFSRITTGNGTFNWSASATNTGTGSIGPGSVTNRTLVTGHTYQIAFAVGAGGTTYSVLDTTAATTVLSAQPYDPAGTSIAFDGLTVEVEGGPANGDTFGIAPSIDQSVFATAQNLITVLNASGSTAAARAQLTTGLGVAIGNLDNALDKLNEQRSVVGTRLREVDTLNSVGDELGVQYQAARSRLEGLDLVKAISDLNQQTIGLAAAQQSFAQISQQTLFDFL